MVREILGLSLKFPLLIIALAAAIICITVNQLSKMPVDAMPEFAPPYIEVQTEAPGLSVAEVEELVTFNLEELLNGTPWLQSLSSISVPGLSSITLTLQPKTDILRARQMVSERLSLAYALPNVAQSPIILQPLSAMSRVLMIGLTSNKVSAIDLSVLAYWNIRPALLSVPGVANVAIWGLRNKQLQVLVDPNQLKLNNVTLDQIISTTGNALWVSPLSFLNASTPGSGGWIETPEQRLEVRHVLPITRPSDLAQVSIEESKTTLGAVSHILEGHQPIIGDALINDSLGLLMMVEKFPGTNTLDVTRGVEEKLAELSPGLSDIQINTQMFRPASFIELIPYHMSLALLAGLLLIILTSIIVFRSWQIVLTITSNLVLAFSLALLCCYWLGATINAMLLAGLVMAFVIMINEVLIDIEYIFQAPINGDSQQDNEQYTSYLIDHFMRLRNGMLKSIILLLILLLPIIVIKTNTEAFYNSILTAFVVGVFATYITSLTLTPSLSFLLKRTKTSHIKKDWRIFNCCQSYYKNTLQKFNEFTLKQFAITLLIISLIVLLAFLLLFNKKAAHILPSFKDPNLVVEWNGPPGTSAQEMIRITGLLTQDLKKIKGVKNVSATIGRAVLGHQSVDVNSALVMILVDVDVNYEKTFSAIKKAINTYPGMFHTLQTYLDNRIKAVSLGLSSDMAIRIFGHDLNDLRERADDVKDIITKISGVSDVSIEQEVNQPQISMEVNLAKAQSYGLKPGDVRRQTATLIAGLEAGSIYEDQKIFQVVVWGIPNIRQSLETIQNLLIETPQNQWIPLKEIAIVKITETPNRIVHESISRRIDVNLNVRGRTLAAVREDIVNHLQNVKFSQEERFVILGGEGVFVQWYTMFIVGLSVCVLLFFLLQAVFDSFVLAMLIFISLPICLLGCLIAAFLIPNFSIMLVISIFAVFGFIIRNIVQLITSYKTLNKNEDQNLIFDANAFQFKSILINTVIIILALFPLALSLHVAGLEIAGGMSIMLICGLITSTLYLLFIVPQLYWHYFNGEKNRECELKENGS